MKPVDPKEYKREIIVMNLFKGRIMLVFTSGFLEGDYKDGRRTVVFKNLEDVREKEDSLKTAIKKWLELVEK